MRSTFPVTIEQTNSQKKAPQPCQSVRSLSCPFPSSVSEGVLHSRPLAVELVPAQCPLFSLLSPHLHGSNSMRLPCLLPFSSYGYHFYCLFLGVLRHLLVSHSGIRDFPIRVFHVFHIIFHPNILKIKITFGDSA